MAVIYVKIELWSLLNAELAAVIPSDGHSMTLTVRKRRLMKRSRFLSEGICVYRIMVPRYMYRTHSC